MDDKEIIKIDKPELDKLMAWQKHRLDMKISYDNHKVDLEKKQIENDVARSKSRWVFWFALLTFLNMGFAVFSIINNYFK